MLRCSATIKRTSLIHQSEWPVTRFHIKAGRLVCTIVLDLKGLVLRPQWTFWRGAVDTEIDISKIGESFSCEAAAAPDSVCKEVLGTLLCFLQFFVPVQENNQIVTMKLQTDCIFFSFLFNRQYLQQGK